MDSINFNNGIKKITSNYSGSIQQRKNKKTIVETKSAQASSLDALSGYGQAMIGVGGVISNNNSVKNQLEIMKKRIAQDEQLSKLGIEKVLDESILNYAEILCFAKDEDGSDLFPHKKLIVEILNDIKEDIEMKSEIESLRFEPNLMRSLKDDDFLYKKFFRQDENGNDIPPSVDDLIFGLNALCDEKIDLVMNLCIAKDATGSLIFKEKEDLQSILRRVQVDNVDIARELIFGKDENGEDLFKPKNLVADILLKADSKNIEFLKKLCYGKDDKGNDLFADKESIPNILKYTTRNRLKFVETLVFGKDDKNNDLFPQKNLILDILSKTPVKNVAFIQQLCVGKDENGEDLFPDKKLIIDILNVINQLFTFDELEEYAHTLCLGKRDDGSPFLSKKDIIPELLDYISDLSFKDIEVDFNQLEKLLRLYDSNELTSNVLFLLLDKNNKISLEEYMSLKQLLGYDKVSAFSPQELRIATKMVYLCGKKDINEVDLKNKKTLIRNLVSQNIALYNIPDKLREDFPLVPKNKDEYCSLLQSLCKSIGIETNELSNSQISEFNKNMFSLSSSIASLSDEEFMNLQIEQEYSREDFIHNTYEIIKDLEPNERQKVYDYFGFELKPNITGVSPNEYSIIGYPVNLNNGKKLAKIDDPNTRAVIEQLRPEVKKFSENNYVHCSNKEIESYINTILELCPELRTQIGRVQHQTHHFDIFKHSLKVMQKIVQNPSYEKLNDSDKKIILLASLLHDGSKAEGVTDSTHANESAFDAFYITKKFNLTKEESNKLYSLIKHHEWLGYTNSYSVDNEEEREERIKSVAYDLHYDNLFELAKIFTEADLKSVKIDDRFYDKFKTAFLEHSSRIDSLVKELKVSQPLLPVTKIPSASEIKEAITFVNPDGSTNIKGVYQDKNGMVIIKFNEVHNETWEKIGFPAGSISKGIDATGFSTKQGSQIQRNVNTGNIKFFAHGLEYPEQLQNFDAFALPDTDALLSVSYMELPESKYRLFRTQGVLLNVDTKYVHGGGQTDSGSGCKKSLDVFKKDYAYKDAKRHSDRTYIAELIKDALGLTDDEYVDFIHENSNKSITEIEPKSYQERLVKAFATINSNERKGHRAYNEMYATYPEVMGVFAYPFGANVGEIMQFIDAQPEFLKQYACDEDLPFIVFGD